MAGKRRPKGDGGVYKATNSSGRTVWVGDVKIDGKRRRVTGDSKMEAAGRLRQLLDDHRLGISTGPTSGDKVTVGEVLRDWMAEGVKTRNVTSSTKANHSWAVDRLLEAVVLTTSKGKTDLFLRDIEVDRLTPKQVHEALQWLMNHPKPKTPGGTPPKDRLSVDALTRLRNVLSLAVDYAILMDKANVNKVSLAPIPDKATPNGRRAFFPFDDVVRLLPAIREHEHGAIIYVMVRLGLRFEEAAALTVQSYNGSTLNVWRSVRKEFEELGEDDAPRIPGQKFRSRLEVVDQLKTKASRRTMALPGDVVEVLDAHLERDRERIGAALDAGESPLLFAMPNGSPLSNGFVNKRLKAICDALDVKAVIEYDLKGRPTFGPVSCHVLRHTMTTLSYDRGIFSQDLADALGQRDDRMIHARYRHTDPNRPRDAAIVADWLPRK